MRLLSVGILIFSSVFIPASASAQLRPLKEEEQGEYARLVRSGTRAEQARAVTRLYFSGARNSGVVLRTALIEALEREVAYAEARRVKNESRENPEMLERLSFIVASLADSSAIPALAQAATGSLAAVSGLAQFGEPAVTPVLEMIGQQQDPALIWMPLIACRFLVEGAGPTALSAQSRDRIRDVAKRYINTPAGNPSVLTSAIDLAIALKDPELAAIVERIAADRNEVSVRGFANPDDITRIQKHAAERAAGKAAVPKYQRRAS